MLKIIRSYNLVFWSTNWSCSVSINIFLFLITICQPLDMSILNMGNLKSSRHMWPSAILRLLLRIHQGWLRWFRPSLSWIVFSRWLMKWFSNCRTTIMVTYSCQGCNCSCSTLILSWSTPPMAVARRRIFWATSTGNICVTFYKIRGLIS